MTATSIHTGETFRVKKRTEVLTACYLNEPFYMSDNKTLIDIAIFRNTSLTTNL